MVGACIYIYVHIAFRYMLVESWGCMGVGVEAMFLLYIFKYVYIYTYIYIYMYIYTHQYVCMYVFYRNVCSLYRIYRYMFFVFVFLWRIWQSWVDGMSLSLWLQELEMPWMPIYTRKPAWHKGSCIAVAGSMHDLAVHGMCPDSVAVYIYTYIYIYV